MKEQLLNRKSIGSKLKIKFKHHKNDINKRGIRKIYLGDYKKLFNYLNKGSIFCTPFEEAEMQLFDNHMIIILTNELDMHHEEWIETKLKNTEIIGVAEYED